MCNCKQDQSIKAGDEYQSKNGHKTKVIFADECTVLHESVLGTRSFSTPSGFRRDYSKIVPKQKVYTCVCRDSNGLYVISTIHLQAYKDTLAYYKDKIVAQFENEFDVPCCNC